MKRIRQGCAACSSKGSKTTFSFLVTVVSWQLLITGKDVGYSWLVGMLVQVNVIVCPNSQG